MLDICLQVSRVSGNPASVAHFYKDTSLAKVLVGLNHRLCGFGFFPLSTSQKRRILYFEELYGFFT